MTHTIIGTPYAAYSKKYMRFACLISLFFFAACNQADKKATPGIDTTTLITDSIVKEKPKDSPATSPAGDSSSLMQLSFKVLDACQQKNYTALSKFIHPEMGLRLCPYAYIDTADYKRLNATILAELAKSKVSVRWGVADGSGDPLVMPLDEYFRYFVNDKDYRNAPQRSVDRRLGMGNSLHNISTIYPGSHFTEFYFPGADPKYGGMDWKSLRLVFQPLDKQLWLVAIVHDQWTI